jgi:hypothetical protein
MNGMHASSFPPSSSTSVTPAGGAPATWLSLIDRAGEDLWIDPLWRAIASIDPEAVRPTADSTDFEYTISRLLVLHELKKSGALTYDEFTVLKQRLLDL